MRKLWDDNKHFLAFQAIMIVPMLLLLAIGIIWDI